MNEKQTYLYFVQFEGTYDIDPDEVDRLLLVDENITILDWDGPNKVVTFEKLYLGEENDFDTIFTTATNMANALDFLTTVTPTTVTRMDEDEQNMEIVWEA